MISIQYVAGIFDGEGYVGVRSWKNGSSYMLASTIVNSDPRVINEIHKSFGGNLIHERRWNCRYKDKYVVEWHSTKCLEFIKRVLPYCIVKKEQIKLALNFPINNHGNPRSIELIKKQKIIYNELKRLKTVNFSPPKELLGIAEREHEEMLKKQKLAKNLSKQNLTVREIGKKIGVSGSMVSKYLNN